MANPDKNIVTSIEPDPFDLANLRLDQSFVESAGVRKLLTTVPVRKPNPQDFVRVHPDPEYRATLAIIELKEDREIYLVPPSIARELPGEFVMATIYAAINRQGVVFLWPVRLPASEAGCSNGTDRRRRRPNWRCVVGSGSRPTCHSAPTRCSRRRARSRSRNGRICRFRNCCASGFATVWSTASTMPSSSGCVVSLMLERPFRYIVVADFEFEFGGHAAFADAARSGERPRPVCMVAKELRSGQTWRLWRDEFGFAPPFPIGPDALFVAYYASAELGLLPRIGLADAGDVLDLFTEFRDRTNGLPTPAGAGLIGALTYFGLDAIGAVEKDEMRALILRGGPWSAEEREEILRLLRHRHRRAGAPVAGHVAAARPSACPASRPLHGRCCRHGIHRRADRRGDAELVAGELDRDSGRADPRDRRRLRRVRRPHFQGRSLGAVSRSARNPMAAARKRPARSRRRRLPADGEGLPAVSPMRELRSALSELRLNDLAVGADGRNRTILSAFRSRTGRNQPSILGLYLARASGCAA